MKIRNGFVSNSSSSSFYLIFNKDKKLEITTTIDVTGLEDFKLLTVEDLDESLNEGCVEKEDYNKFKKLIQSGKQVVTVSIDNCDEHLMEIVRNSKNVLQRRY